MTLKVTMNFSTVITTGNYVHLSMFMSRERWEQEPPNVKLMKVFEKSPSRATAVSHSCSVPNKRVELQLALQTERRKYSNSTNKEVMWLQL